MLSLASLRSLRSGQSGAAAAGASASAPSGPLRSALAVVLATLGWGPRGPRSAGADLAPWTRHEPARDDGSPSLAYLQTGPADAPRLLLVHGTPGSAAGWSDYVLDPPAGLEVVALDRPGFGASAPQAALPSLEAQARALRALLPRDGRKTLLLGHSMGGPIAARLAAEEGERVAALILVAAALDPRLERIHPLQRLGDWAPLRALLPRALRHANAELLVLADELAALQPWLARITVPVHVLHGTADALVPVANVDYLVQQLRQAPSLSIRRLEGHNHFLPWNAEPALRELIAEAAAGLRC